MKYKKALVFSSAAMLIVAIGLIANGRLRNNTVSHSSIETLAIIHSASSIQTYRVKRGGPFRSEKIGGYAVVGKGLDSHGESAKQLKAILESHLRKRANPRGQKGCLPPEPGIAIRFLKGDQSVDILMCFRCYDLMVVNDTSSQWRDFMDERDELVRIAKILFPDDADIQGLSVKY